MNSDTQAGTYENPYLNNPRKPVNLNINVHHLIDDWFEKNLGIRARSQAIFCTPDIGQAREYGTPFEVVVPKGLDYRLVYSPEVIDLIDIEHHLKNFHDAGPVIQWLENKNYVVVSDTNDIPEGFKGEIMLISTQYELREVN